MIFSMFFTGTVQFRLFLFSRQIMCPKSPLYQYNFNKLHHLFECFRKIPCDKKIKIRLSKNRVRKSRKMKQPKENRVSRLVCFVYEYSIWWLFCTNSLKKKHTISIPVIYLVACPCNLPKIHKLGIPLRPIVSFVNSPTYAISGYLARILSPVVGNTDYTVKNSCEFADFIRDKTLNACEELVSFDVVSLFTKIPVDLAVKVAEERLREDASLGQRTPLPVEDIIHLLSFCLKTTKFTYNGTYWKL